MNDGKKYLYFDGEKDKDFCLDGMRKYVSTKQEIDKFLEKIMTPIIRDQNFKFLDACCGIGHMSYFLSIISPKSIFLGVDQTPYVIDEAKKLFQDKKNLSFEVADVYDLPAKYLKTFDISINHKTLSWLPYYDQIMKSLFSVTTKHIFLSSLFYDDDIDFQIRVRNFQTEQGKNDYNAYYNVYSFPHFQQFAYDLGAKKITAYDFEIDMDIPKPPSNRIGTYTVKLENGKRLQISGAIVMYWKIVRIDL